MKAKINRKYKNMKYIYYKANKGIYHLVLSNGYRTRHNISDKFATIPF